MWIESKEIIDSGTDASLSPRGNIDLIPIRDMT